MQAVGAEGERADGLGAVEVLAHAVDDTGLDEVDDAVGEQLGVDAEVAVVRRARRGWRSACAPMPIWMVAPSGMRSATRAAMRSSMSSLGAGGDLEQRSVDLAPAGDLETCSWLRPNVRGIRGLASRKNRARPMNDAT